MSRTARWLIGISAITALVVVYIQHENRRWREAYAKERLQRDQKEFDKVKAGSAEVSVFSPDLIVMLANDPDCIRNLKSVRLCFDDLSTPGYEQLHKLSNVHYISFDESRGVDTILPVVKDMPSVDSLYFYVVAMTDNIQSQLAAIPTLKKVRHGSIERKDAEALARKLPNVLVEIDDDSPEGKPIRVLPGSP